MKKRSIRNIIIAAVVIAGAAAITAIYSKNQDKKAAASTTAPSADLSFAVLGDVHENIPHFQKAIDDLYDINPKMDALVLNGDVVDQGLEEQYDSVQDTLDKNKKKLPDNIIKNIGNHEFFDYDIETNSAEDVQMFIGRYLKFSGEDKVYHDAWLKGYHFISLGSEDGNSDTIDSMTAVISDEQMEWFKEKMAENYEKGRPIFVFLHQPVEDFTVGGYTWATVKEGDELRSILSQYPEAVVFSSHTHKDLNEGCVEYDKPYSIVHTGSMHYTVFYNTEPRTRDESYIKGVYIEVFGNKVTVKGRDFKERQWIFTKEIDKSSI